MFRLTKSLSERIYLLSAKQISVEKWEFKVRGQSKNIYEQKLSSDSYYCSCPDHKTRRTFCKHLLFLVARVASRTDLASNIHSNSSNWEKKIFEECSFNWVERLKGRLEVDKPKLPPPTCIGNDCPICFEEMKDGDELIQCIATCKNWLHKECINLWLNAGHSTCPLCRSEWIEESNSDIMELNSKIDVCFLEENKIEHVIQDENSNKYEIIRQSEDFWLKDFCRDNGINISDKKLYYELNKIEIINYDRDIILFDRINNVFIEDSDAKNILRFESQPKRIKFTSFGNYNIYVLAISGNRKILANQGILILQMK